jgi:cytochrome P450
MRRRVPQPMKPDGGCHGSRRTPRQPWRPLGIWPEVWRSPLDFCLRAMASGGVVHLGDFPRTLFLVTSPSAIRRILVEHAEYYARGPHWRRARAILGDGLATVDGAAWRHQRAIAQPAFQRDRLSRAVSIMREEVDALAASWQAAENPREVAIDLAQLVIHVLVRGLFDVDLRPDTTALQRAVSVASHRLSHLSLSPWGGFPSWLGRSYRRHRNAMDVLDEFAGQITTECRSRPEGADDLVSILLRSRGVDGKPISERQIRDELLTMLTAAIETQLSLLTWLLVVLATMPPIQSELRAEARTSSGEVADLVRARQTVDETLRLYPSGWIFDRIAVRDDILDGVPIRKGATMLVCPYAVHRHPDWWPDPNRFDPDRFLPARAAGRGSFTYLPFGGGHRTCIGAPFAIALATLFVSKTAERFQCILSGPPELVPRAGALLAPPPGIRIQFHEVAGPQPALRSWKAESPQ